MKKNIGIFTIIYVLFQSLCLIDTTGDLIEQPELLNHPSESLTIQEIVKIDNVFWQKNKNNQIFFDFNSIDNPTVNWLKLKLHNSNDFSESFFLEFSFGPLYMAEFFSVMDGKVLEHTVTGHLKTIADYPGYLVGTELSIPPGESRDIYIKASSVGMGNLHMLVNSKSDYANNRWLFMVMGLFFGGSITLVLFNFILFFVTKDTVYIHYVLYQTAAMVFHFLYSGLGYTYLFPEDHLLASKFLVGLLVVTPVLATFFLKGFLQFKISNKDLDRIANIWILVGISLIAIFTFAPLGLSVNLAVAYIFFSCPALCYGIFVTSQKLQTNTFIIAWGGALASIMIASMSHLNLIPVTQLSLHASWLGVFWEALFLSMALGERINNVNLTKQKLSQVLAGESNYSVLNEIYARSLFEKFSVMEKNVTIMFVDIVHFSLVSTRLGSLSTFEKLSDFHATLNTIIVKNNGTIDRSLGDGVLAVFGGESAIDHNHSLDAFQAAIEIQEYAVETKIQLDGKKFPLFFCRIGINRSDVVMGNMGGGGRIDYTVVGSGVNFASRLENACNPHRILLSATVREKLIQGDKPIQLDPINIKVKHHSEFIEAYEFDPFSERRDLIMNTEGQHFNFLNQKPIFERVSLSNPIVIYNEISEFQILDFSLDGFGVSCEKSFGRACTFMASFATIPDIVYEGLKAYSLHEVEVEVRWSRKSKDCYKLGLKLIGLSDGQRKILFNLLKDYQNEALPSEPAPLASND